MTDEPQLPEAELAALADGSLPSGQRERLRARIEGSPELAAALADQQRAVTMLRALDEPAPAALHARIRELTDGAAAPWRAARWRRPLFIPAATALAVAIAALVVLIGGAGTTKPTIPETARLALAAATSPAPGEDAAHRNQLRLAVDGIAFPYYERADGWTATGARSDRLQGRRVVTVFYRGHGMRVGYAIVSGAPLPNSGGRAVRRFGVAYWLHQVDGAQLVSWRQAGHTCVIAGRSVSQSTLVSLASAEEREAAGQS
jgi:anti-sigma factor RsiW